MQKLFLYPLNTFFAVLLGLLFTFFNFSYFYKIPSYNDIFRIFIIMLAYLFISIFFLKRKKINIIPNERLKNIYKPLLVISSLGFVIELVLYGIPLLAQGGRDEYKSIPVLHVLFYSILICSIIFSSIYGSAKSIIISFAIALVISVLFFTRQMLMVSFMIFMISMFIRYSQYKKIYIYILFFIFFLTVLFSFLGDIRQQSAGDYVDNYVYMIGGANENGTMLGTALYWVWLYIASPIYNLYLNFNVNNEMADACITYNKVGDCFSPYISNVVMPNTISKYIGAEQIDIESVVQNLNVGTGYAKAARLFGLAGVISQITLQFLFYVIGYILTPSRVRVVYTIYFSALSFFMIFDNLFVKGEFFFVFIIIMIIGKFFSSPIKENFEKKM
ncbi:O-antigen polymerase [Pectobacterium brasiliense]|uniref:O-antigen polymerase n=1 Tax=Pectobacterium brasiliense TaxID=180957 RepID=UPI00259FF3BE|nr:O-antigen polymerase [Pectobacterium brasiliense]WJM82153.1 O-antigen polymerase [Pectobacterium brasiliense]